MLPKRDKRCQENFSSLEAGSPLFGWLPQGQSGDKEHSVPLYVDQITPTKAIKQSLSVSYWIELPVEQKGRWKPLASAQFSLLSSTIGTCIYRQDNWPLAPLCSEWFFEKSYQDKLIGMAPLSSGRGRGICCNLTTGTLCALHCRWSALIGSLEWRSGWRHLLPSSSLPVHTRFLCLKRKGSYFQGCLLCSLNWKRCKKAIFGQVGFALGSVLSFYLMILMF